MSAEPKVIVALDFAEAAPALALSERIDPARCRVKVGKELFTAAGPALVETLAHRGFGVFLDLKFHDIPNTVAAACRSAARLGVWMMNVHALGGTTMLNAAREAVPSRIGAPKLVAVTLLTSLEGPDLAVLGLSGTPQEIVLRLARLSAECGLDGVVCSPREAAPLRAAHAQPFALVTPGIRPADASADDQQRIATPARAITEGASYLVIGRPITRAADPLKALELIEQEIVDTMRSA